jgi:hypothetical protein
MHTHSPGHTRKLTLYVRIFGLKSVITHLGIAHTQIVSPGHPIESERIVRSVVTKHNWSQPIAHPPAINGIN